MAKLRKLIALFIIALSFVFIFAEGEEHEHDENCGCEIADSREISLQATQELLEVDSEVYQKLAELEENINLIYELADSKLSIEDFENYQAQLDERFGELETRLLNAENVIETAFPSIQGLVYELAQNLMSLEERLTSYVQVSVDEIKEVFIPEALDNLKVAIEDLQVTLDIHDGDILKIYDELGKLSDSISALNEQVSDVNANVNNMSENLETLALKVDFHDQDIVNIYDALAYKADTSTLEELEEKINKLFESTKESIDYGIVSRIELLEEYTNMIYELANSKPSLDEIEEMIIPVKENLNKLADETAKLAEKTKEQDIDIIKLYDAVSKLADEVKRLSGKLSTIETIVNELRNK
ncbi:hypothetical protein [Fervidobacterium sp. 2310opik-2]|uniref:hypothetical protein n=1 Tax=Fervidobacterium sp. 2310opik-2 TaxID=1755815 RepID=UPI0013E01D75|nr:hypothetical protein [Fervidobacterium sp. 2310opik-2]KAF2962278.1 hypothetical protein AS161_04890 [Fervidobacterium sp. 2310opik-2]HOJ94008.1 hypothetical protein [Fervidobacterium nodosum]